MGSGELVPVTDRVVVDGRKVRVKLGPQWRTLGLNATVTLDAQRSASCTFRERGPREVPRS